MSKTCECGHHRDVHLRDTSCASPELCMCRKFVEAKPVPSPMRYAEMADDDLHKWWLSVPRPAFAALRDAILAERDAEWAKRFAEAREEYLTRTEDFRTRAERAEESVREWQKNHAMECEARNRVERECDEQKAEARAARFRALGLAVSLSTAERELEAAKRSEASWMAMCGDTQLKVEALTADLSRSRDAHHAAIRERDAAREQVYRLREAFDVELAKARTAESALGEAKREEQARIIAEVKDLRTIYTNVPPSDYAVGWWEACDAMLRKFPPAIDPESGSTCKPDCARVGYCAPGTGCHATPQFTAGAAGEADHCSLCGFLPLDQSFNEHCRLTHPATPSGEGVPSCNQCGRRQGHGACECATPQPEATLADVIEYVEHLYGAICQNANHTFGGCVPQKFADFLAARRLLALAQTGEGV